MERISKTQRFTEALSQLIELAFQHEMGDEVYNVLNTSDCGIVTYRTIQSCLEQAGVDHETPTYEEIYPDYDGTQG